MGIQNWPLAERPRERLLHSGAAALSDAELLAISLRTGTRDLTAVDLARQLLGEFGGIGPLLCADQETFCRVPGVGPAKYAQLQAIKEIGRRDLGETLLREPALESVSAVERYLQAHLRHLPYEAFGCLFLDARHRPLVFEILAEGSITSTTIYPRRVVQRALFHNASAVIIAHNHPSGSREPSQADRIMTEKLRIALELVEVRLLDHFIVGDGAPLSMAENGFM